MVQAEAVEGARAAWMAEGRKAAVRPVVVERAPALSGVEEMAKGKMEVGLMEVEAGWETARESAQRRAQG